MALAHAIARAAASAHAREATDDLPAQLRAATQRIEQWSLEGLSDVQATTQLLQQAAAPMQQYYTLPAVEAERELALAQAAAGRSCAYLRCANLGGEGGPATGQGAGSMRCRWVGAVGWAAKSEELPLRC